MPHTYSYDPTGKSAVPVVIILDVAAVIVGVWCLLTRWTIDWPIGLAIAGGLLGAYDAVQVWRDKSAAILMIIATLAAMAGVIFVFV